MLPLRPNRIFGDGVALAAPTKFYRNGGAEKINNGHNENGNRRLSMKVLLTTQVLGCL